MLAKGHMRVECRGACWGVVAVSLTVVAGLEEGVVRGQRFGLRLTIMAARMAGCGVEAMVACFSLQNLLQVMAPSGARV